MTDSPICTAVGEAILRDRAHAQHADDVLVTAESHPVLFVCLEDISHDCGAGAGHINYSLPAEWAGYLTPEHEAAVAALTEDERSTFCTGEETEMEAIARRHPLLERVSLLLSAFHEDFEGEFRPTLLRVDELLPTILGISPAEELSLSDVRRVAAAVRDAEQPGHEGPFGLFDYTAYGNPVPHHVRDFRLRAGAYGSCLHSTTDQEEARQLYEEATRLHVALAATRAAIHLPRPGQVARDADRLRDAIIAAYAAGARDVHEDHQPDSDPDFTEAAHDYAARALERLL